ncbi:SWFGD domain-containing protein [Pontibacter akesuensis]|uniref:SWFGD domain-containing protein n=1 Tax=Pontibacter akesuensis TaxID=388950 RepID=A0A1I7KGX7_9BACT|nr:SWFGD domain-containing protein [Pontibacter akesuensis]GHA79203.1 hypothetical protein GCM10007389_36680 [Pontibacter akesuensis]SFU96594.1 hypothetical protein SAMN04487941_3720 [Pontibacter akesuensis]
MRSYENSGYNPFNDNETTRTRGSARNYYSGDMDLTDRHRTSYGSSSASGYGNRNSGMGSGIDAYSSSGTGRTTGSFYDSPRSSGSSYGRSDYGSSDNYGSSNRYGSNRDNDNDRSFWDKAENKVSSWFNDDDNDNRRRSGMSNRDSYSSYDSDRNSGRNSYGSGTYNSGSSYSGNYGSGTYGTGYTTSNYGTDYDRDRNGSDYGRSSNYGSGSNYGSSNYGSSNYGSGNRDRMGYRSDSSYGSSNNNYGSSNRYGSDYDRNNHDDHDRGFLEKAGDTVKSWFSDDDNDRRRSYENRDRNSYGSSSSYGGNRNTYGGPPYTYGSSSRRDYEW